MVFDFAKSLVVFSRRDAMRMNENLIVFGALLVMLVVGGLFIHNDYRRTSAENNPTGQRKEKRSSRVIRDLPGRPLPSYEHILTRRRRGFRSYFYNYLDELSMSICGSIPSEGPGLIYAVRRTCGENEELTCKQICTDQKLKDQAPKEVQKLSWSCSESLHVYKRQPALADNYEEYVDSYKLGLAVYRHHSCSVAKCGPNYCCCKAVATAV